VLVGLDVAHVTDVPLGAVVPGVGCAGRVEMAPGGHPILVPDAEFMNVETMFARSQAGDLSLDVHSLRGLGEGHCALDLAGRLGGRDQLGDGLGDRTAGLELLRRGSLGPDSQRRQAEQRANGQSRDPILDRHVMSPWWWCAAIQSAPGARSREKAV